MQSVSTTNPATRSARPRLGPAREPPGESSQKVVGVSLFDALEHEDRMHPRQKEGTYQFEFDERIVRTETDLGVTRTFVQKRKRTMARPLPYGVCCSRMGRHCPKSFNIWICNPFCEGSTSEWDNYGATVTNFFKFEKWLITLFFILGVVSLPSLYLNTCGPGIAQFSDGQTGVLPDVFRTTVGNLGEGLNDTFLEIPADRCPRSLYEDCRVPKADIGEAYGVLDAFGTVVVIMALAWLMHFERREVEKVHRRTITLEDYAVFVSSVPRWATPGVLREHFHRVAGPDPETGRPWKISDVSVVEDHFYLMGMFIQRGKLLKEISRLETAAQNLEFDDLRWWECLCCAREARIKGILDQLRAHKESEQRINRRLRRHRALSREEVLRLVARDLREDIEEGRGGGCLCCSTKAFLAAAEKEYEDFRAKKAAGGVDGKDQEVAVNGKDQEVAVAAFVVFDDERGREAALRAYPDSVWHRGCCQRQTARLFPSSKHAHDAGCQLDDALLAEVREARARAPHGEPKADSKGQAKFEHPPVPIEVLEAPAVSNIIWENLRVQSWERCVRSGLALLVAVGAIGGSFAGLYLASSLKQQLLAFEPQFACDKLHDVRNATGLSFRGPGGSFDPTAQSAWPEAQAYVEAEFGPGAELLDPQFQNQSLRACYCLEVPWFNLTVPELRAHPDQQVCPDQFCPSIAVRSFQDVSALDICQDWAEKWFISIGLTAGASVVIVAVNVGLNALVGFLSRFESHPTLDDQEGGIGWKLALTQFFNTAVLSVLLAAYIPGVTQPSSSIEQYGDFSRAWYANVGCSLVLTLVVVALQPPLLTLLAWRCKSQDRRAVSAPSQFDLEQKFLGPEGDFQGRLAHQHVIFWVCIVFSAGMPILYWVGFAAFVLNHFADKLAFARVNRTPPFGSGRLSIGMTRLLPGAVVLHLLVAIWQLGNPDIFNPGVGADELIRGYVDDQEGSSGPLSLMARSESAILRQAASRLASSATAPIVLVGLLLVVLLLLQQVVACFAGSLGLLLGLVGLDGCLREDGELEGLPLLSQALKEGTLTGPRAYSMFQTQKYRELFVVDEDWGRKHSTLRELVDYDSEPVAKLSQLRRSSRFVGGAAGAGSDSESGGSEGKEAKAAGPAGRPAGGNKGEEVAGGAAAAASSVAVGASPETASPSARSADASSTAVGKGPRPPPPPGPSSGGGAAGAKKPPPPPGTGEEEEYDINKAEWSSDDD